MTVQNIDIKLIGKLLIKYNVIENLFGGPRDFSSIDMARKQEACLLKNPNGDHCINPYGTTTVFHTKQQVIQGDVHAIHSAITALYRFIGASYPDAIYKIAKNTCELKKSETLDKTACEDYASEIKEKIKVDIEASGFIISPDIIPDRSDDACEDLLSLDFPNLATDFSQYVLDDWMKNLDKVFKHDVESIWSMQNDYGMLFNAGDESDYMKLIERTRVTAIKDVCNDQALIIGHYTNPLCLEIYPAD